MTNKTYNTNIDFRILGDKIKFLFFISNTADNTRSKTYNKDKCMTITFDTDILVEAICLVSEGTSDRMFLRFDSKGLKIESYLNIFGWRESDIILEVFKNSKGVFGFESVVGGGFGAFLSHPNYFSIKTHKATSRGVGAIKPFTNMVLSKNHALQMIFPGANLTKQVSLGISFDMDIHIQSEGQYVQSLGFKLNKENIIIIEGNTTTILPPKQIINTTPKITLDTTYLSLNNSDLASRKVLYDYKKVLKPQNVDACSLTLIGSNVYAIKNPQNLNVNLEDINLTKHNLIEIPYNISREIEDGKIKATKKVLKNGKALYPLGWINEIRDNEIVSSANKCISLKFTSKEQIIAFTEKLKNQQIGNIETYPTYHKGRGARLPRTYGSITQWVERSKLDEFNDVKFSYDGDGYIKNILICPRKKTKITNKFKGIQCGLYSDGTQYLTLDGKPYEGDFHIDPTHGAVSGADNTEPKKQLLNELYGFSPIGENTATDFYLTTFGKKDVGLYSSFTANSISVNEPDETYDLRISGSGFTATSATTGTTCIPISNINRTKVLPMIGDINKQYKPYTFSEVYYNNNGSLTLDDADPTHYMTYTVRSSGVYRFTYKAYLDIKYTDTKWCDYVDRIAPSGVTATTGVYPQNNYQTKRLINTSIIRAGDGETNTILQDTGFKLHPGYRYKRSGEVETTPSNSGLLNFDFTASLLKYTTGTTGTTSATPVTIKTFKVLRCKEDGTADNYLTLDVSENDKFSNNYNVCTIGSGVSATTIFGKQIPVIIDTGLMSLTNGDIIELAYDLNWNSTSKGNFYGGGGTTNLTINLGHELDTTDTPIASPWYRGIKLSTKVVNKNLFFDATKKSKEFKMQVGGTQQTIILDGALYMSDQACGNIIRPTITPQTFRNQTFLDSTAPNNELVWDHQSQTPTNNWQNLIENNTIKDYTLSRCSTDICPLTKMHKDGVFCFYLPTYNDEYGAKCDFTFPQIAQSYVIVNKFKNFFGGELTHYIVITPGCNFYKPCAPTKLKSDYDILHQTRPDRWKVENIGKKITINGKEITVISDKSTYYGKPLTLPNKTMCKYFCDCGQNVSERLNIDPIYGISGVFTDLEANNCGECVTNSRIHCAKINKACKPVIIEDCTELRDYDEVTTESGIPVKLKGKILAATTTDGPPTSEPVVETLYGCNEGICVEDSDGMYTNLDNCIANCESRSSTPKGGEDGSDPTQEEVDDGGIDEGACIAGYYWCDYIGRCISVEERCGELK